MEPWQAGQFAAAVEGAREHLAPWIPWALYINDADSARTFLQRVADAHARDADHFYGIRVGEVLVGGVRLANFNASGGTSELGVWLAPEMQGRGLASRASRCLIDWAFQQRGISRVEWRNDPRNARSSAVARRLGMTREGLLRSSFEFDGLRRDEEVWSLLAEEWPAVESRLAGSAQPPSADL
ncbi:GNAT family N-acetyltransferase [Kribbella catacumbae]|uniref:GNAT family N-acetyltransferase n=1 Tax=Kribbella catacumbae TaxID=460086 RepID=UPI001ED9C025|nr:GNAT family protein [Kribbella catacumbae]